MDAWDLPAVAKLFLRFLGHMVKHNQQKAVLEIFKEMGGVRFRSEGEILPFKVQEQFAQAWNPAVRLCYDCGKALRDGRCDRCTSQVVCAKCGCSEVEVFANRSGRAIGTGSMGLAKNICKKCGSYLGYVMQLSPGESGSVMSSNSGLRVNSNVAAQRQRAAPKPR